MIKKRTAIIGAVILVILTSILTFTATTALFVIGGNFPFIFRNLGSGDASQYAKINQVKEVVKAYFVEPVEDEVLLEGAVRGVVDALDDPYSRYMDEEEYADMMEETSSQYAGIGVVVTVDPKDNLITVVSPFEGSPGEKAGILPGDKIIRVNGKDVWGDKLNEAVKMMKGPAKTDVDITIYRSSTAKTRDITITRDIIKITTVSHKTIDDNIGYIRINRFYETTSEEFNKALDDLYAKQIKGLIIDVRNNPGGLLDEVAEVTDRLVPKGMIVYMEDRQKKRHVIYSDAEEIKIPLVILVNEGSASASEILSGAVKDHEKGLLVGTKTFGKGVVQSVMPLGDGTGISITTSKYFTPDGVSIHGKGIEPDVTVKFPEDFEKNITQISEEEDVQLQKALKLIKQ